METRLFIQYCGIDGEWYSSITNNGSGFISLAHLLSHLEKSRDPRIGLEDRYRIVRKIINPEEEVLISD